jgi:hypothetical protein
MDLAIPPQGDENLDLVSVQTDPLPGSGDHFCSEDEFIVERILSDDVVQSDDNFVSDEDEVDLCASVTVGNPTEKNRLWDDLRQKMTETKMNTQQMDGVLEVLHKHKNSIEAELQNLPKSYKTLCKQSRKSVKSSVSTVSGHQYKYFGLKSKLIETLSRYPVEELEKISSLELVWNTDGFPLHHSTKWTSWPVLCFISNLKPVFVFEVTLTAGKYKPLDTNYLTEFISELKSLMRSCELAWSMMAGSTLLSIGVVYLMPKEGLSSSAPSSQAQRLAVTFVKLLANMMVSALYLSVMKVEHSGLMPVSVAKTKWSITKKARPPLFLQFHQLT